jgi:hypothetical protein
MIATAAMTPQPAPAEPARQAPGNEVDWGNRDNEPEVEQRHEVRCPEDRHAPQLQRVTEGYCTQPETPNDCSTGKGPNDTLRSCAREVDDGNQLDQVCRRHNDKLPRCQCRLSFPSAKSGLQLLL